MCEQSNGGGDEEEGPIGNWDKNEGEGKNENLYKN